MASICPSGTLAQAIQVVPRGEAYEFYYTTSTTLMLMRSPTSIPRILQPGLHGREIRCVALYQSDAPCAPIWAATGSEDKSLVISSVNPEDFSFQAKFIDSTFDGAVQNVAWSPCKPDTGDTLLFYSASKGSLHCMKVHTRTFRKLRVWNYPVALAPKGYKSDGRVMALDVLKTDVKLDDHTVVAAYSDGRMRVRTRTAYLYIKGHSSNLTSGVAIRGIHIIFHSSGNDHGLRRLLAISQACSNPERRLVRCYGQY